MKLLIRRGGILLPLFSGLITFSVIGVISLIRFDDFDKKKSSLSSVDGYRKFRSGSAVSSSQKVRLQQNQFAAAVEENGGPIFLYDCVLFHSSDSSPESLNISDGLLVQPLSSEAEIHLQKEYIKKRWTGIPVYRAEIDIVHRYTIEKDGHFQVVFIIDNGEGASEPNAVLTLTIDGVEHPFESERSGKGWNYSFPETVALKKGDTFSLRLNGEVRGALSFEFTSESKKSKVEMTSDWPSPSFQEFLPDPRQTTINSRGFSALWERDGIIVDANRVVKVLLFDRHNVFSLMSRILKYSIFLVISMFLALYLVGRFGGITIHIIQYLLFGTGIGLFYLLMIAFAEFLSFPIAYWIGAAVITVINSIYAYGVLASLKKAFVIFLTLGLAFAEVYRLLNMTEYTLLAGTLFLSAILIVLMRWGTSRIE